MAGIMGLAVTGDWNKFDFFTLAFCAITLALLNGASNILNQVTDLKSDKINKPYRPIPRGIITKKEALSIALLLYLAVVLRSIWVNLAFANCIILLTALTIGYSTGPRFKDKLWLNNISIAIARGGIGFLAGWSIFADPIHPFALACASVITVYLIGMTTCKDLSDIKGDRKTGSITLPVKYGRRRAIQMIFPFGLLAFVMCLAFVFLGTFGILGAVIGVAYFITPVILDMLYDKFWSKEQARFENNKAWPFMYGMIGFSYLIFLLMAFGIGNLN